MIAAASAQAESIGVAMNITVVDAGGNLTAFERQDRAWLGSNCDCPSEGVHGPRDMPTADLQSMVQPDQPLYGIETSEPGHIIAFPGGIPLKIGDEVVGAIGVSGGMVEQD